MNIHCLNHIFHNSKWQNTVGIGNSVTFILWNGVLPNASVLGNKAGDYWSEKDLGKLFIYFVSKQVEFFQKGLSVELIVKFLSSETSGRKY